jgi:hypothetical protein
MIHKSTAREQEQEKKVESARTNLFFTAGVCACNSLGGGVSFKLHLLYLSPYMPETRSRFISAPSHVLKKPKKNRMITKGLKKSNLIR